MTLCRMAKEESTCSDRTCNNCGRVLSTTMALKKHLTKVYLCDRKGVRRQKNTPATCSIYRCKRCGKALTSAAGLRIHMTQSVHCNFGDHRPIRSTTTTLKPVTSQQIFSNSRLHHSRPNSCDNLETTQLDQNLTKTVTHYRLNKLTSAKMPLDEYLLMTKQKERQQQQQFEIHAVVAADDNSQTTTTVASSTSQRLKRNRNTDESREEMSPIGESYKRVRSETVVLAAQTSKMDPSSDSTQKSNGVNVSTSIAPVKERKHGGDILTDGCCCRNCVRKWTRTIVKHLECLDEEVTNLRLLVNCGESCPGTTRSPSDQEGAVFDLKIKEEVGTNTESWGSKHPNFDQDDKSSASSKLDRQANVMSASTSAPQQFSDALSANSLTEKYDHLNEQIITNERALEDSLAFLKETSEHDGTSSLELRTQLDELHVFIDVEKGKRDEAVAAIIAQQWNTKRADFRYLLGNMVVKSKPIAEKAFHEECAEIARQLEEKNKILSKLGGLIGTAGLGARQSAYIDNAGKIPKYTVESMTKSFLERQRDDIFMCLLRSSPHIYLLTKERFAKYM